VVRTAKAANNLMCQRDDQGMIESKYTVRRRYHGTTRLKVILTLTILNRSRVSYRGRRLVCSLVRAHTFLSACPSTFQISCALAHAIKELLRYENAILYLRGSALDTASYLVRCNVKHVPQYDKVQLRLRPERTMCNLFPDQYAPPHMNTGKSLEGIDCVVVLATFLRPRQSGQR